MEYYDYNDEPEIATLNKNEDSQMNNSNFNTSGRKYLRPVTCMVDNQIDVYAVLDAFNCWCPARQHAIKKLLCAGERMKNSELDDLREARDAIDRAIQMELTR